MRPVVQTFIASDADYICVSQTRGSAGALVINGVGKDLNSALPRVVFPGDFARVVSITSDGTDNDIDFTVTGYSITGAAISETLTGPSSATVQTTALFAIVTGVSISAATSGNITVGIGSTGASNWVQHDTFQNPFLIDGVFDIATTIDYSVFSTPDNPNVTASPYSIAWAAGVTGATADQVSSLAVPRWGSRVVINSSSGSGALTATFRQAG